MMQLAPNKSLPSEIRTIRDLTAAMRVAADNNDWQEVQRIDVARFQLLRTMPTELFTSNNVEVRDVLTQAMSAIQHIEQQAKCERDRVAGKLKDINQRHRAAKAYATAS